MEVSALRDWIIVVYGGVGVVATCIVLALIIIIYRKVATILDATKATVDNVRSTSSMISENVIQPIARAQGFVAGLRKVMGVISSISKKGGDEEDGE